MNLRELRDELELTQEELAEKTGLDQTTISQLERGCAPDPRLSTLRAYAKVSRKSLTFIAKAIDETVATA